MPRPVTPRSAHRSATAGAVRYTDGRTQTTDGTGRMAAPPLLRNSERTSWRRCRWRWNLAFNRCLTPRVDAPPLRFGSLVHRALEGWYIPGDKRGVHPVKTFLEEYDAQIAAGAIPFGTYNEEEEWNDARALGEAMLTGYVDLYGQERHIRIVSPEMRISVPILHPKSGRIQHIAVGSLDAVGYDKSTGKFFLFEHKTAKVISLRHLPLDEQAGTYWALAGDFLRSKGIMKAGDDIDLILYNFLRKGMPDKRPKDSKGRALNKPKKDALQQKAAELGLELPKSATIAVITEALESKGVDVPSLGEPSKTQPSPLFAREPVFRGPADRENVIWRMQMQAWEIQQARQGKLPIYKNPTRDCSWDCAFYDVCELHETGSDWEEMLRLGYVGWDPYSEHLEDQDIPKGM